MSHAPDTAASQAERDSGDPIGTGRKVRWLAVLVGAVAVVLAILLTLSLSFGGALLPRPTPATPQILTLTGINRSIVYLNGTTGSIGPPINDSCPQCPMSFSAGTRVSVSLMSFQVKTNFSSLAMHVFLSSTIPAEPFGGYSCPNPTSCGPPPAVTNSSYILVYSNGLGGTWYITFDPPVSAPTSDDGGVSLTIFVTTCATINTDWNYCG